MDRTESTRVYADFITDNGEIHCYVVELERRLGKAVTHFRITVQDLGSQFSREVTTVVTLRLELA